MNERIVSCPCGAVELKITAKPVVQFYCHCGDCRRIHGGAYAPEAMFPAKAVEVIGETISFTLKTTQRFSCAKCGARLYADVAAARLYGINGTLLDDFAPAFHMHCREAVAPVRDDLPHYAQQPAALGGEDTQVDW
jgi:hypothetical protein